VQDRTYVSKRRTKVRCKRRDDTRVGSRQKTRKIIIKNNVYVPKSNTHIEKYKNGVTSEWVYFVFQLADIS
jgi:hypothetical protein